MRKFFAIALFLGMCSLVAHLFNIPLILVITVFAVLALAVYKFSNVPSGSLLMAFADLLWPAGKDNMAGIIGEIFFCPKDDIETIPALSAVGSLTMAAGDIVCKTGKKFYRIYHTQETGKVDYNTVGEIDGKSKQNILSFFYPGDDAVLANQERLMQNTPGVYICKDTKGNLRLLGVTNFAQDTTELTLDSPAYLQDSNGTTGDAGSSRRGTTFNVIHKAPHRPVFYVGDVPLTAAP